MTLSKLDNDLLLCQAHLTSTNSMGTEIESFLTKFLLVHICSEYEKEIKKIITDRAKQSNDKELISFIEKTIERIRNIKSDDLKGNILKRFSDDCLKRFNNKVGGKESLSRYESIIANRDQSAHGNSINITFNELIKSHEKAKEVLIAVSDAINPKQIWHIIINKITNN